MREKKKKAIFCVALAGLLFALYPSVHAQQPPKIPRIGYLGSSSSEFDRVETFRQGLRELGYVEGQNFVIERRYTEGKPDRERTLAAELVRLKVDVIVTRGSISTRAAKEATATIPIIMAQDSDPVGNGFVASLARPGGNITGLSNFAPELSRKRLELLKEVVPKLLRVAVFGNASVPGNAKMLKETELASGAFGVKLQYLEMQISKDLETTFRAAKKSRADAILLLVRACCPSLPRDCRTRSKEPAPDDIQRERVRGSWGAYVLRRELGRLGPARRRVRGQDSKRR